MTDIIEPTGPGYINLRRLYEYVANMIESASDIDDLIVPATDPNLELAWRKREVSALHQAADMLLTLSDALDRQIADVERRIAELEGGKL